MLNLVAAAETDPAMPNGRGRTPGSIHENNTPANWRSLVNEITNATFNATHFYYYGHGGPRGIGFSENTPTDGILSDEIALGLRNARRPFVDESGNLRFNINRPYRFVFLNGCNTANGLLAESFGIPAILKKTLPLSQKRLFLGWTTTQYNSIANNAHIQFSQRFWNEWLPVNGPYDSVSASVAIRIAAAAYPAVSTNSLARFGDQSLKWME